MFLGRESCWQFIIFNCSFKYNNISYSYFCYPSVTFGVGTVHIFILCPLFIASSTSSTSLDEAWSTKHSSLPLNRRLNIKTERVTPLVACRVQLYISRNDLRSHIARRFLAYFQVFQNCLVRSLDLDDFTYKLRSIIGLAVICFMTMASVNLLK